MTLRGSIEAFPLETILQLLAATGKTGQLEVRAEGQSSTLGLAEGRLVAASAEEDVGELALGTIFATRRGEFEFVPWRDPPAANLSGDLEQLLDRAVVERDRLLAIREVIPHDKLRFRLSDRAAERGEIRLSSDQWRALLAVNGERDVYGVAEHLQMGRGAARGLLSELVQAGLVDTTEPPEPSRPGGGWGGRSRFEPGPLRREVERRPVATEPEGDLRSDLSAALEARMGAQRAATEQHRPSAEQPLAETPVDVAPEQDERLAAMSGLFGPAQPAAPPPAWQPPPAEEPAATGWGSSASGPSGESARASETAGWPQARWAEPARAEPALRSEPAARPEPTPEAPPPLEPVRQTGFETGAQEERKKRGLFGMLRREESSPEPAAATRQVERSAGTRAGRLAALANALLAEYKSGQYGANGIDDRMANLFMRADEQADPIDRQLPVLNDRLDVSSLEREALPEEQSVPYIATLVRLVYEDAEKAFGREKARRGYRAAVQHVFGGDPSALQSADVAPLLPKV